MISQELKALITQLELVARKHVSGPLLGDALSSVKGGGFEFNQLREYIQGDDVRFIDWKASARSDKTLVRQYLEDRNRIIYLVVDVSASMDYGSTDITKADVSKQLAAVLAFVGLHSKDSVGLILFSSEIETVIPPRPSRGHILQIVKTLFSHTPTSKTTNLEVVFEYLARLKGQRAIVCLVSDFMAELEGALMKVAAHRHELLGFRCVDPREHTFPAVGTLMVEERETNERASIAGSEGRIGSALMRWHERQHDQLVGARIDTLDIEVGAPFAGDLLQFLRQRLMGRR